jgi:hypothetical protein
MSFKQDVVGLLLKNGAEGIMKYLAYRDAEKEVIRINTARFPDCEFVILSAKHKDIDELINQGWRDALVAIQNVHFPQEFLGKKILLFKPKQKKKVGFV